MFSNVLCSTMCICYRVWNAPFQCIIPLPSRRFIISCQCTDMSYALWLWKKNTLLIKKRCRWNPLTLTNKIMSIWAVWLIWQPLSLLFVDYKTQGQAGEFLHLYYASSLKKCNRFMDLRIYCRLKCRQIICICKRHQIHFLKFLNECAGCAIYQMMP